MLDKSEPFTPADTIAFLLIPEFSMLSFASILEPLRMANRASDQTLYKWRLYTPNNRPVEASNGLSFANTHDLKDTAGLQTVMVIAGIRRQDEVFDDVINWLKALARSRINIGATSSGTELLARAGLLKNRICTIHWENQESLKESFSDIIVSNEIYEIDRDRITCSGGVAGLDMMLHIIAKKHGLDLAKDVAEQSVHPAIRSAGEKQRMEVQLRYQTHHPRLLKAIELMQSHLEDTLSCKDIGDKVGMTSRQLERLFNKHLGETPSVHYLNLRLEKAHHLLKLSTLSILQLSTACGFTYTSHFARCYRKKYGISPSEERKKTA